MKIRVRKASPTVLLLLLPASSVLAQDDILSDSEGTAVIDTRHLDGLAGRQDTEMTLLLQSQVAEQSALLQENSLSGSHTGMNAVAEGALDGATGFTTVIQNTGNQVILQNTTLISVTIKP